ncbi:MAG: SUMF1/EgtB/PvdO family nonheme iron enzyme [Verrucomicrobia bacterium]|nr:SUMF1/EgtB/PvdO family nonheme iron enzyme [Verrucomicrobiota bacterium]
MKSSYLSIGTMSLALAFAGNGQAADKKVDFVKDIQPIIEEQCVTCHRAGHAAGDVALDTKAAALKASGAGKNITPGNPAKSTFYTTTVLPADDDGLMPPKSKGGPLSKEKIALIKLWIEQGAEWPDGVVCKIKAKAASAEDAAAEKAVATTAEIHKRIVAKLDVKDAAQMKEYSVTIPGSDVTFTMVPIPGGEFTMGSPDNEPGHKKEEGPQRTVKISPFWMEKNLATWNEYELFMLQEEEKKTRAAHKTDPEGDKVADAMARPSQPYVDMTFGMGRDGFPAISMTQHAASQYCKWLSAKTGQYYRLPTEAEWEYACRAGTKTAYFFGDDASKLGDYAWYVKNCGGATKKVGLKKPNPWGLYDMHGLLWQWTLDQLQPYTKDAQTDPWVKPTKPYPHATRGGSWQNEADRCRSAARYGSDPSWKVQDPQLPKSIWYHTDAQFVGFRVVRPLTVPPPEQLHHLWHSGVEKGD